MRKHTRVLGLAGTAAILFAACSGSAATPAPASQAPVTPAPATEAPASAAAASVAPASAAPAAAKVRLQLQWAPQAQFAGYFAADAQGYYKAENLEVQILDGGPTIVPSPPMRRR